MIGAVAKVRMALRRGRLKIRERGLRMEEGNMADGAL